MIRNSHKKRSCTHFPYTR